MAKGRRVYFRVTEDQYSRIRNNSSAKGHKTVSSYIRWLALSADMHFNDKFNELYDMLMRETRKNGRRGM